MLNPTIFLIDDDLAIQESLSWLIETVGHQVKSFSSATDFLSSKHFDSPGCLILDVRLPGMSGLQLQQKLNEQNIKLPIIIISGHGDVPMAVKAMQQGALVFLEKPFRDQDLLDNIQVALETDKVNREKYNISKKINECIHALTSRENEVLELIVEGNSNRNIAEYLKISVKTVDIHRARVMEKMRAGSLPELVKMILNVRS